MNDAPKKRPLFQIHLSTCNVLMFVAGGLMWANLTPRTYWTTFAASNCVGPVRGASTCYGWPMPCFIRLEASQVPEGVTPFNIGEFGLRFSDGTYYVDDMTFEIPIDVTVNASILLFTVFVAEWLARRRERRHE